MSIILIEGPDGASKTTLAATLAQKYGLTYHHEGPPPTNISCLEHYGGFLEEVRRKKLDIVIDRFALGERVYGPIYRQSDRLESTGWRLMRRLIKAAGVIQILCFPEYKTCLENWKVRRAAKGEMITREDIFQMTYDRWGGFISEFDYIYDYEDPGKVLNMLEVDIRNPRPSLTSPLVGNPDASYLFVGASGLNPDSKICDLAFFGEDTEDAFFNRALERADFIEDDLAFTNAVLHRPQPNVQRIPQNRSWKVIAVGGLAVATCASQGVTCTPIPHPEAYRDGGGDVADYAELLRAAQ